MLNLSNEINWELLENAKYVIVEASNEDEGFTVSVDGIYAIDMNEETLKEAIKSETVEVITENWEATQDVKTFALSMVEYSLEINVDDSGENDLYKHEVVYEDGKFSFDKNGKFVKTFTSEAKAMKEVQKLGKVNIVF